MLKNMKQWLKKIINRIKEFPKIKGNSFWPKNSNRFIKNIKIFLDFFTFSIYNIYIIYIKKMLKKIHKNTIFFTIKKCTNYAFPNKNLNLAYFLLYL